VNALVRYKVYIEKNWLSTKLQGEKAIDAYISLMAGISRTDYGENEGVRKESCKN
jgi:hypothetical protein